MTTQTYYRVQDGRCDLTELFASDRVSSAWNGDKDLDRDGVSVCKSIDQLAAYLATDGAAIPYGSAGWVLIAVEGTEIAGTHAVDASAGEILIRPSRIVDSRPIPDEVFEEIGRCCDLAA